MTKEDFWIEKFKKDALPEIISRFKPARVIIFGSRIKGDAKEDSDIDVIIVSEFFKDVPFLKRMPLLVKTVNFPKHIDFICYTEDEFEKIMNESSVVMDALKNGIELSL